MMYSVAGTSRGTDGTLKIRFANDFVGRLKQLIRKGHSEVNLVELGNGFTKAEVVQILMAHPQFQSEEQQSAIYEYAVRNAPAIVKEIQQKELV